MNVNKFGTWEEAVSWLVGQPDQQDLVKACYYDLPLIATADRYWHSPEWQAIRNLLPLEAGYALDVGAGNGIASYALAKDGWGTTALEPDPSERVGAGAIRTLARDSSLGITVVEEFGEKLPFADASFELVHARQVLHHANDLKTFCRELFRVLRPGGLLIATREHVISNDGQLSAFLNTHALHNLYGGEHAYRLKEYISALKIAGFHLSKTIGPLDSVINYAPFTQDSLKSEICSRLNKKPGGRILSSILKSDRLFGHALKLISLFDQRPGRLYSFVAKKGFL